MSGRRVRIKGVANIPVRRKTEVTSEKKENEKEIQDEKAVNQEIPETQEIETSGKHKVTKNNDNSFKIDENTTKNDELDTKSEVSDKTKQPTAQNSVDTFENSLVSQNVVNNATTDKNPPDNRFKRWKARPSLKIPSTQRKIKFSSDENETQQVVIPIRNVPDLIEIVPPATPKKVIEKSQNVDSTPETVIKSVTFDSNTNFDSSISPNKSINRARIKPVPRFNIRRNSFHGSASESEDDSRKSQNRQRNDSVCSIGNAEPLKDELINKEKIKILSHRKIRYTDQSRKLATAKREFQVKFGHQNPDRKRLTMMDLIFYNPTTNPMTEKPARKNSVEIVDAQQKKEEELEDDPLNLSDTEEAPVPQVKVGPDGEIILDEQSLVIEQTGTKRAREQIENSQIIIDDLDTGYGIYKKPKRCKDWTFAETLRFYRTLNTVGTDFSLMLGLFPGRTRRDLKMKFKKEEKNNRMLVDKVLMNPLNFNLTELEQQLQKEKDEEVFSKKKIEIDKNLLKKKKPYKGSALSREIDDENEIEPKRKRVLRKNNPKPKNGSYDALQKGMNSLVNSSDSDNDSVLPEIDLTTDEVDITSNERPTRICRLKNPSNFEELSESGESNDELNYELQNQQKLIKSNLKKVGTVVENLIKLKNKDILHDEVIELEEDDASFIEDEPEEQAEEIETNIVIAHSENAEPDKIYLDILSKNATDEGIQNTETKISLQIKQPDAKNEEQVTNSEIVNKNLEPEKPSLKSTDSVKEKPSKNLSVPSLGNVEPGSVMIMSNLDANGETVYKVYMVTPENEKIPIDLSPDIIQSLTALEKEEEREDVEDEEICIDIDS